MKLCWRCGELNLKPGLVCNHCGAWLTQRGTVYPPTGEHDQNGNVRTSPKTPRQKQDDA